ncbi:DUF4114 domain-containing protein [Phormidium yuhuli AB48]|uniref:DUF4114 domain-containing protein n=1 Tax=Phormidium yuhuli AB48 TaxID=2940671 RepID=A0ABY5AR83_9CYAN|nr:DUF4114 domain-containing protein [Phormidium yuhuli]USR91411.1 DUF4114 domain-containing protein [Phormidium yuhuli AB48]
MFLSNFAAWLTHQLKQERRQQEQLEDLTQTFILEPIYTPSGITDGGDDSEGLDLDPIDDLSDIDDLSNSSDWDGDDSSDEVMDEGDESLGDDEGEMVEDPVNLDNDDISDEDIGEEIPFVDESEEGETDADEEISDELDESEEGETDADEEISDELDESEEGETDADEEISDELDESKEGETDADEEISDELDESETDDDISDEADELDESETDDDISDEAEDEEAGDAEAEDEVDDEDEDLLDDEDENEDDEDEDEDEVPFSFSVLDFNRGVFRVGSSGEVGVDFLFDGGAYQGEVAFFSLAGMEEMEFETTEEFIAEAARRAASGSEQGHIVISVADEGARFTGSLMGERDHNSGVYQGVKTFNMTPGDEFGVMLVPNGRVSEVVNNPSIGGSRRPLFSLSTANPNDEFHLGQIADLTGDGNTFVFEDKRFEISDYDYDDVIFQIRGAVGDAVYVGDVIAPELDWRETELGQELVSYAKGERSSDDPIVDQPVEDDPVAEEDDPVTEEDDPVAEEDDPVTEEDDPVAEEDDPVAEEDDPVTEEDDPVAEEDDPVAEEDDPVAEEDDPVAEEEPEVEAPNVIETEVSPTDDVETLDSPFADDEILRDDWERSTAYTEGEDIPDDDVPDTVDPSTVVNPWDIDRESFLENLNPEEDGFGNSLIDNPNGEQQAGRSQNNPDDFPPDGFGNPINQAPVVTTYDSRLNTGSSIQASNFFSVYDPDGDPIQNYWFYDNNNNGNSGYLTLNGVKQDGGFFVNSSQLNNVRFVAGSEPGVDTITVQAYDGQNWSRGSFAQLTTQQANRAPVVTARDHQLHLGTSVAASDLFDAYDPDGDPILGYWFDDFTQGSTTGYFTVNGLKFQNSFTVNGLKIPNGWNFVAAKDLDKVRFVAGSEPGVDKVQFFAIDSRNAMGSSKIISLETIPNNRAPVVSASPRTVNSGSSTSISQFFTVTDADGDTMTRYSFRDDNSDSTSGYFTVNGVKKTGYFTVSGDQLHTVRFVGGSEAAEDRIRINAHDGTTWGRAAYTTITTQPVNRAPVVSASPQTVNSGSSTSISQFFTVTDADGDTMTRYSFRDDNSDSTSGYFTVNGVKKTGYFTVSGDQLHTVRFVGGSEAAEDRIRINAHDGTTWGRAAYTTITTQPVNRAPVVSASPQTVNSGSSTSISQFFTVTDADGDTMTRYSFRDDNSDSTSGYFTVNGVKKTGYFTVSGDQLHTVRFVGGSEAAEDRIRINAHDGTTWGRAAYTTITTQPVNRPPVVRTNDQTVKRGQSITPNFTVTDADGDTITRYAIYDGNTNSNSGYFTLNGVKQSAGQVISFNANQLSGLKFVGGSTATTDNLFIAAYDGKDWSSWSQYTVTTQGGSAPTVNIQNATVKANTAMSLNFTTSDKDGDQVTRYEFFDSNAQATSGYFTVNGVRQAAGRSFFVDADKLHTVKFVGGAAASTDRIAVRATDGIDGWGEWSYVNFTTQAPVTNDWFDLNIKDTTIRALARERFQDGILCRDDMIYIFDSAKDGGVVDANELADLKILSSDVSYIKMADHARVLSQKIAHGNNANEKYLGQSLGNLYAGSSADHLQKLIDKHFFGKDLPNVNGDFTYSDGTTIDLKYMYAQGELFQNGIEYSDIHQGIVGNCYYLAALAGVALQDAQKIEDMFIDNGDGTYTVRFFNNGKADYVTVNRFLPTYGSGYLAFAKVGMSDNWWGGQQQNTVSNTNNELWVALAEKAYAQINEAGWIGQDGTNSYKGIERGWMHGPVDQVANWSGGLSSIPSSSQILQNFNNGKVVTFGSKETPQSPVVKTHAYTLVDYVNGKFKLFNPWGIGNRQDGGYVYQTWEQLVNNFSAYTVNG